MPYSIEEVTVNKRDYMDLLLLGDEQEDMIERYLDDGTLFVLSDNGVKCVAVVVTPNSAECELKNLATDSSHQGKGYGRAMVEHLLRRFLVTHQSMLVGTGDVPRILRFYHSCGFRPSHTIPDFFTDNYAEPIIEDGIRLRDMVYLRADRISAAIGGPGGA